MWRWFVASRACSGPSPDATVSRLVDTLPAGLALFATSTGNVAFYVAGAIVGLGYGMSIPLVPPVLINAWFVADVASCSASS